MNYPQFALYLRLKCGRLNSLALPDGSFRFFRLVWHDEALTSVDWPYYSVSRTSFQNALAVIGVLLDFYQVRGWYVCAC